FLRYCDDHVSLLPVDARKALREVADGRYQSKKEKVCKTRIQQLRKTDIAISEELEPSYKSWVQPTTFLLPLEQGPSIIHQVYRLLRQSDHDEVQMIRARIYAVALHNIVNGDDAFMHLEDIGVASKARDTSADKVIPAVHELLLQKLKEEIAPCDTRLAPDNGDNNKLVDGSGDILMTENVYNPKQLSLLRPEPQNTTVSISRISRPGQSQQSPASRHPSINYIVNSPPAVRYHPNSSLRSCEIGTEFDQSYNHPLTEGMPAYGFNPNLQSSPGSKIIHDDSIGDRSRFDAYATDRAAQYAGHSAFTTSGYFAPFYPSPATTGLFGFAAMYFNDDVESSSDMILSNDRMC
ncbi:MAG: hypothetical protein Q9179_000295, partial [Wetmoreana sp. 5 TL-2023]